MALKVVAYLQIDRADLAEKTYNEMINKDEDNCLTQLASCWLKVSFALSYNF